MTAFAVEPSYDHLPEDWKSTSLGEVAQLRTGGSAPQGEEYFLDGKYPFVRVQHFDGTEEYLRRWDLINEHAVKDYRLKLFSKGTILFPKSGASIHLEKRTKLPFDAYVVGHLCCVEPLSVVHGDFLFYLLKLLRFSHAVDGSTLPYLNLNQLQERRIPLPPLSEQRKIAAVLGLVQRAIEQQERLIALTTELKKALLHRLFTEGLRGEPQKQTEIGPVPESWEVATLASLLEIKHGYAFDGEFFVAQGHYVLLTPGHFFEEGGFRDQKDKTKYYVGEIPRGYLLAKGDLLVAMTEQKAGLLGSAINVPESEKFLHNQRLGLIQNLDEQRLGKLFLFYFFNTAAVRKQIFLTSSGSKVRHTSPGKIRELSIALPSLDEQGDIVQLLRAVDAKLEVTERKRQTMTDLFRTLLHHLMTAQIRVNDLDLDEILRQPVAEIGDGSSPNLQHPVEEKRASR